jgi:hypothetical protein
MSGSVAVSLLVRHQKRTLAKFKIALLSSGLILQAVSPHHSVIFVRFRDLKPHRRDPDESSQLLKQVRRPKSDNCILLME